MEDTHRDSFEAFSEMVPHPPADTLFVQLVAEALSENTGVRGGVVYKGYVGGLLSVLAVILDDG